MSAVFERGVRYNTTGSVHRKVRSNGHFRVNSYIYALNNLNLEEENTILIIRKSSYIQENNYLMIEVKGIYDDLDFLSEGAKDEAKRGLEGKNMVEVEQVLVLIKIYIK